MNYIQILYLCILKQQGLSLAILSDGCELHSNLVSLHSETTLSASMPSKSRVVNYIQILYLCILKQQEGGKTWIFFRCELHSNLVSLHSETTFSLTITSERSLWITFKSCIFAFWNNRSKKIRNNRGVVNYIQILYLCILKQRI